MAKNQHLSTMPPHDRALVLDELCRVRNTQRLLTYVTSRRPNQQSLVSRDVFSQFYEHLRRLPAGDEIDLFLMTHGGDVTVPLPLQYLLREYAKRVNVLVPAECHSAGTMIALGGDKVYMSPLGQLSPIDPSMRHTLNPLNPTSVMLPNGMVGQQVVEIAVEQVFSYLSLATDKAGLQSEQYRAEAFSHLTKAVHPIALGEIHRTHSLIRVLAVKLLHLHLTNNDVIGQIVEALTEKLYNHGYGISRREAREFGLPIEFADHALETAMMDMRRAYVDDAKMDTPFALDDDVAAAASPLLPGVASPLTPGAVPTPGTAAGAPSTPARANAPTSGIASTFPITLSYDTAFIGSSIGESTHRQTYKVSATGNLVQPFTVRQAQPKWESQWK